MKLSLQIKLAGLIILGTASSLLGSTAPTSFEFEWQSSDGRFTPTFLTLKASLDNITSASTTTLIGFEITTPNGVWTPSVFTPTGLTPTTSPYTITGYSGNFTVGGTFAAPVLTFGQGGVDLDTTVANGGHYDLDLQTTSITGSTFVSAAQGNSFRPTDLNNLDNGSWVSVPLGTTDAVPDAGNSLVLIVIASMGLSVYHRFQGARA